MGRFFETQCSCISVPVSYIVLVSRTVSVSHVVPILCVCRQVPVSECCVKSVADGFAFSQEEHGAVLQVVFFLILLFFK